MACGPTTQPTRECLHCRGAALQGRRQWGQVARCARLHRCTGVGPIILFLSLFLCCSGSTRKILAELAKEWNDPDFSVRRCAASALACCACCGGLMAPGGPRAPTERHLQPGCLLPAPTRTRSLPALQFVSGYVGDYEDQLRRHKFCLVRGGRGRGSALNERRFPGPRYCCLLLPPARQHRASCRPPSLQAPYGHGWGLRLRQSILCACIPVVVQVGGTVGGYAVHCRGVHSRAGRRRRLPRPRQFPNQSPPSL